MSLIVSLYAVYAHHGRIVATARPRYQTDATAAARQFALQLPAGNYTAAWRDTHTGHDAKVESFTVTSANRKAVLESPGYSEDIALIVRATR
jgi:hypothetical protein